MHLSKFTNSLQIFRVFQNRFASFLGLINGCRSMYLLIFSLLSTIKNGKKWQWIGKTIHRRGNEWFWLEDEVFQWESQCLICGKRENRRELKTKLTKISKRGSDGIRKKVLEAADVRRDKTVLSTLSTNPDLFSINAHYHHLACYQNYIAERNLDALTTSEDFVLLHDRVAKETWETYKSKFENGELILCPVLCGTYRQILAREVESPAEEPTQRRDI